MKYEKFRPILLFFSRDYYFMARPARRCSLDRSLTRFTFHSLLPSAAPALDLIATRVRGPSASLALGEPQARARSKMGQRIFEFGLCRRRRSS